MGLGGPGNEVLPLLAAAGLAASSPGAGRPGSFMARLMRILDRLRSRLGFWRKLP
jgi:hypothetical protein